MEQHWSEYRTVAIFGSVPDAERARGLLESDGIVAAVQAGLEPAPRAEAVRLLVPAGDLARARDLLAPDSGAEPAPEPGPAAPLDPTWTIGWLALLVAALVALLASVAL